MSLFSWQTLLFVIPIAVGSLLALGAAFGMTDSGADGGEGHDLEGEGAHLALQDAGDSLALGRVPLVLRLLLLSLSFGGLGLMASYLLAAPGGISIGRSGLAAALALVGSWFVSGRLAGRLVRRLPLVESETVGRRDLLGSTGQVVLRIGPAGGFAQVRDRRGNLHQVA